MLQSATAGYPADSLLASEIAQQPELWLTTLERVGAVSFPYVREKLPVIITGAGTSAYAGQAIAAAWQGARAIATTDLLLQTAEEIECHAPGVSEGGLLISLARSGNSPESTAVVECFQKKFAAVRHLAITCNSDGRLAHMPGVDVICLNPLTNDRSLAMTASFSNLTLAGLCLLHSERIGLDLPSICVRLDDRMPELYKMAERVAEGVSDRFVVLSSGMRGLGVEAVLKATELTGGHVLGLAESYLGLRHGPLSALRRDTPVLCFVSSNKEKRRYEADLVEELHARDLGRVVVIGDEASSVWPCELFVQAIAGELPDSLRTPFEIVFAQLVAYHFSRWVKVDPDNPSPDGTVTRVVKPFGIY